MCPHCGQPFGPGPNCQYCGAPAPAATGRPGSGRGWAFGVLGLVTALVAGLVIWRVVDPPSTQGSAQADAAATSSSATATGTDETGTDEKSTGTDDTDSTRTDDTGTDSTDSTDTAGTDTTGAPTRTTSSGTGGQTASGTLRVGLRNLPSGTDPATDSDFADVVWHQVFDTLTTYQGSKAVAAPDLATSWKASEDATEWTFTLAAGRTFQDRTPVDGKAVCANFDFWNTRKGDDQGQYFNWQYYFQGFAGQSSALYRNCTGTAGSAVLTFARPVPALPDILTQTSFSIHSPASLTGKKPVGSGPFAWVDGTASKVSLRAVPGGQGRSGTVEFIGIPDPDAMVQAVKSGDLQLAYVSSQLPRSSDVQIEPEPAAAMISLNLYGSKGALADDGLRSAVVAAVDRPEVAKAGEASAARSVLPDVFGGPAAEFPRTDPAAAKAALQPKKLTLTLGVRGNSRVEPQMAAVVTAELQQAGVTVKKKTYTNVNEYYDALEANQVDLSFGQVFAYTADVGDYIGIYGPNATYGKVLPAKTKAALTSAMGKALGQPSYDARQSASTAVLTDLLKQNAVVPLTSLGGGWLVGDGVSGLQQAPFGAVTLAAVRAG